MEEPREASPGRTEQDRAIDLAYKAVARRDRTVAELRAILGRKRVEPQAIDAAVEELIGAGVIDDARYARRFAEDKRSLDRWGAERIARDLRRRGVADEHVERAVSQQDRQGEIATALALLGERFPAGPADDRERDRAWRLLVRRGYEPELAYEAVREHGRRVGSRRAA